jgi:polygalacturonase
MNYCSDFSISGKGLVDGQGYNWWMRVLTKQNKGRRPILLNIEKSTNGYIGGIKWQNSPFYHINLDDVDRFLIENFEIYVDVYAQK